VRPILAKAHTPAGVLIICHDISGQKASEQRLLAANRQLCEQIQQIQGLQASLKELAIRDPLTGLFNRRYLQETLARELSQAVREGQPLSLVMLDVDRFKELNDLYGHQAGDQVLQALSQVLTALTRKGDIVSRYGGDEFLVALVNTPVESACQRVEDWQQSFSAAVIEHEGRRLGTTFSAGVASFPDHANTCEQLIRLADVALYQSKASGGNCVLVSIVGKSVQVKS
jgi:diguanylate cyclase (GGDEF)-like protein